MVGMSQTGFIGRNRNCWTLGEIEFNQFAGYQTSDVLFFSGSIGDFYLQSELVIAHFLLAASTKSTFATSAKIKCPCPPRRFALSDGVGENAVMDLPPPEERPQEINDY